MEESELIAFDIISKVGTAKSQYIEALEYAKKQDFNHAQELISKGNASLIEGHKVHSKLIQRESLGEKTSVTVLLMHAEDQFMNVETIKFLIIELIEMREKDQKLGDK